MTTFTRVELSRHYQRVGSQSRCRCIYWPFSSSQACPSVRSSNSHPPFSFRPGDARDRGLIVRHWSLNSYDYWTTSNLLLQVSTFDPILAKYGRLTDPLILAFIASLSICSQYLPNTGFPIMAARLILFWFRFSRL